MDDLSLSIEEDTCTLIAGANGSGKSLLMSIIAGLETPTNGKAETYAGVGLVFQEPDSQILGETPREDIAFGPGNLDLSREEIRERVENALAETGLVQRADFPARSLSGGEKRRLAAAGVLAMDAKIIIFDEPYANMDYQGVLQVNRLIQKLRSQKKTIIILSHETEKCMAMADRFIALNKGKIVFDGGARQALEQNLEEWGIHHPLKNTAHDLNGLVWL
ncbi:MAG: energy-coupling factor ABC transporter ATP-binding protein [Treponema sp.]|nr:energy-coupling factor ABC transporter ATP-binding protein [Treponema sp.]